MPPWTHPVLSPPHTETQGMNSVVKGTSSGAEVIGYCACIARGSHWLLTELHPNDSDASNQAREMARLEYIGV